MYGCCVLCKECVEVQNKRTEGVEQDVGREERVNWAASWHIGRVLVLTRNTCNVFPVRPLREF